MDRNWLIRTKHGKILGPIRHEKLIELLNKGSFKNEDEACSGNGYWFYFREKSLVQKYILDNQTQSFNPICEAKTVLSNQDLPSNSKSNLEKSRQGSVVVNFPSQNDLEYPSELDLQKKGTQILKLKNVADSLTNLPSSPKAVSMQSKENQGNQANQGNKEKKVNTGFSDKPQSSIHYPSAQDLDFPDLIEKKNSLSQAKSKIIHQVSEKKSNKEINKEGNKETRSLKVRDNENKKSGRGVNWLLYFLIASLTLLALTLFYFIKKEKSKISFNLQNMSRSAFSFIIPNLMSQELLKKTEVVESKKGSLQAQLDVFGFLLTATNPKQIDWSKITCEDSKPSFFLAVLLTGFRNSEDPKIAKSLNSTLECFKDWQKLFVEYSNKRSQARLNRDRHFKKLVSLLDLIQKKNPTPFSLSQYAEFFNNKLDLSSFLARMVIAQKVENNGWLEKEAINLLALNRDFFLLYGFQFLSLKEKEKWSILLNQLLDILRRIDNKLVSMSCDHVLRLSISEDSSLKKHSLNEIRKSLESVNYGKKHKNYWFGLLLSRFADKEKDFYLGALHQSVESISKLRKNELWLLSDLQINNKEVRGFLAAKLLNIYKQNSIYGRYLLLKFLNNKPIKKILAKDIPLLRKPNFKIRKDLLLQLLRKKPDNLFLIYQLFKIGHFNQKNMKLLLWI